MVSHRPSFHCALALLAVSAVAAARQTPKPATPAKQKNLQTLSAQQIFKRVSPAVMVVESLDAKGKVTTLGSGVVIAPGRIITNRHVIEDGVSFRVVHNDKKWPAKLIKVDPDHDLAELSVAGLNAPAVTVLDSSKLAVGETVYAIGAPEGLELTISEGLISGLRDFDKGRVIQTSAAISPGSSGGGLFDAQGRLVGITTFYLKEGQSLNFALPAEWTLALNRQPAKAAPAANQKTSAFQALVLFEIGYRADQAGKYDAAARAYEKALRLAPDFAGAWLNLGAAYERLGLNDKAINAWKEAVRLKPDEEMAWRNLGIAYNLLGRYEKAVSADHEAVGIEPDDEIAWYNLGVAYERLGQFDKELNAEQEAIRIKPEDEEAWVNLGVGYAKLGQFGKAVSAEKEAVRLKPGDGAAWRNLGISYNLLGQYDKAVSADREAIRIKPGDALAWFALGFAFEDKGRQSEVIKVYQKLKTLDPKLAEKFFQEAVLP